MHVQAVRSPSMAEKEAVVVKATIKAAEALGLKKAQLARVLGVSAASVTNLYKNQRGLAFESAAYQAALAFIQVFRSLAGLVGTESQYLQTWLQAENRDLGQKPLEAIQTQNGLYAVLSYLDNARVHA